MRFCRSTQIQIQIQIYANTKFFAEEVVLGNTSTNTNIKFFAEEVVLGNTNTNTNTKVFAEEVVLGNRVLSRRWSDQSAQRVKVSTAILEVKQSESIL